MKILRTLSIIMSTLIVSKFALNPTVFAMEPNGTDEKQIGNGSPFIEEDDQESDQSAVSESEEMKNQIQDKLLRVLFFRPDRIDYVKQFLPSSIQWETIPSLCRTFEFWNLLKKNDIKVEGDPKSFSENEKENEEQKGIKQIIEEDNLEEFQKEVEPNQNIRK